MQEMEKRALIAVILCLGILFLWQGVFSRKPVPLEKQQQPLSERPQAESVPIEKKQIRREVPDEASGEEKEVVVDSGLYTATFSTRGAALKSWKLKKYKDRIGSKGKAIEMVANHTTTHYPLALKLRLAGYENENHLEYKVVSKSDAEVRFIYQDRVLKIERSYTFEPEKYSFLHQTRIWHNQKSVHGDVFMGISEGLPQDQKSLILAPYADVRNFIYHSQDKTDRKKLTKMENDVDINQVIHWAGIENRYFVSALINRSNLKPYLTLSSAIPGSGTIDLRFPFHRERGKDFFELDIVGYFGPKVVEHLKKAESSFAEAVDFGIFSVICLPLLKTMNFFNKYVGNYGVAIILLTLLIRILFHPLTKKSLQSMREMQRIQPQIAKIKEKFKDDRQRMNKEVMELMRANKVNPLGGCLPLLFQMPIFFALYRVLYNAIELYQAPFFGWIQDLSAKDPYYITPVLMGIAMFFQQKLTPSASVDPMQRKMMAIMPIIFSFFMIPLPSGLVIYILFSTVIQVASQLMVNRELSKKGH